MMNDNVIAQLSEWRKGTHVIAFMGEFSAGKSTLLNVLLGQELIPTKVTVTDLPPVWLSYGAERTCVGLTHEGAVVSVDLHDLGPDARDEYVLLRMAVPASILEVTDIIDTPGISDPRLAKGALAYIGGLVDGVVWCSAANQAWRQSEKAAWTAFPEGLRDRSLLVLTRADKMRNATDLAKVTSRCQRETSGLFADVVSIASVKAMGVPMNARHDDPEQDWVKSGAHNLVTRIAALIASPKAAKPQELAVAAAPVEDDQTVESQTSTVMDVVAVFDEIVAGSVNNHNKTEVLAQFRQCFDIVSEQIRMSDAHLAVLKECLVNVDVADLDLGRLYAQVRNELKDFSTDAWCNLHPSQEA